jgi:hypothetical protein
VEWIVRFIRFHRMRSRDDLFPRDEVAAVTSLLEGTPQLVAKLLATTMIYTHILQQGGHGVPSPLDDLGI